MSISDDLRAAADWLDASPDMPGTVLGGVTIFCHTAEAWWQARDVLGPDAKLAIKGATVEATIQFGQVGVRAHGWTDQLCTPSTPILAPRPTEVTA